MNLLPSGPGDRNGLVLRVFGGEYEGRVEGNLDSGNVTLYFASLDQCPTPAAAADLANYQAHGQPAFDASTPLASFSTGDGFLVPIYADSAADADDFIFTISALETANGQRMGLVHSNGEALVGTGTPS